MDVVRAQGGAQPDGFPMPPCFAHRAVGDCERTGASSLLTDRSCNVIEPWFQHVIAQEHLVTALAAKAVHFDVRAETHTASHVTTHLALRIACERPFQILLRDRNDSLFCHLG